MTGKLHVSNLISNSLCKSNMNKGKQAYEMAILSYMTKHLKGMQNFESQPTYKLLNIALQITFILNSISIYNIFDYSTTVIENDKNKIYFIYYYGKIISIIHAFVSVEVLI